MPGTTLPRIFWAWTWEVSYQVWQALERAEEARGLIFSWQKMCRSPGQVHLIIGLLDTHLSPTRFLPLIERLVEQQFLTPCHSQSDCGQRIGTHE